MTHYGLHGVTLDVSTLYKSLILSQNRLDKRNKRARPILEVCILSNVIPEVFGVVWNIWVITLGVLGSQGFKDQIQQQGM